MAGILPLNIGQQFPHKTKAPMTSIEWGLSWPHDVKHMGKNIGLLPTLDVGRKISWLPQRPLIGNELDADFLQLASCNEIFGISVSPGNGSFDK